MLKTEILKQFIIILDNLAKRGPLEWKEVYIFLKKKHSHIPLDWSLKDYNQFIVDITKELKNETYLYYKDTFDQRYFVIGDKYWIVVIGENGIMETAFPPNHYNNYLSEDDGYIFLGR